MNALIFIMPHERHEAIEAYKDQLTSEQVEQIEDAPETAIVQLNFGVGVEGSRVIVIEEG